MLDQFRSHFWKPQVESYQNIWFFPLEKRFLQDYISGSCDVTSIINSILKFTSLCCFIFPACFINKYSYLHSIRSCFSFCNPFQVKFFQFFSTIHQVLNWLPGIVGLIPIFPFHQIFSLSLKEELKLMAILNVNISVKTQLLLLFDIDQLECVALGGAEGPLVYLS